MEVIGNTDVKQGNLSGKFKYEFKDGSVGRLLIIRAVDSPEAEDSGGLNQNERALSRRSARQRNLDLDAGEEVADKSWSDLGKNGWTPLFTSKNYYNWRDFDAKLPITPFIGAGIVKLDRFFFGGGFQYSNSAALLGKANRLTVEYLDSDGG